MTLSRLSLVALLTGSLSIPLAAQVTPESAPPAPPPPTTAVPPATPAPPATRGGQPAPPAADAPATPRGRGVPAPAPAPEPPQPPAFDLDESHYYQDIVRIGSSYSLNAGEHAGDLVVVFGNATVDGHVHGDIVVVLGELTLGPTAVVEGDIVVVGGSAGAAAGTNATGEFVVIGGSLNAPPGFAPRGEHVIIGSPNLGSMFRSVSPWITQGLLWGRVIVPSLGWIWVLVAVSAVVYLALAVLFPAAVSTIAGTVASRPLTAFFAGLLTLLLVGPLSTVLAISVVGIIVIPFIFFAVLIGGWLGKIAVFQWMGGRIVQPSDPDSRGQMLRSLLIGMVVVVVLYMIPVIGLMTWAVIGTVGLGAATLTFFKAMRRERPARPPAPAPPPAPIGATPASVDLAGQSIIGGEPGAYAQNTEAASAFVPPAVSATSPMAGIAALPAGDFLAYPRATFLDRLAAGALDALLVAVAMRLFAIDGGGRFFLLLMLYSMAFWAWKGTSVGGIICGLRVIRTDGTPLRPVDAVVRGLSSLFSFAALGIGFFWILLASNQERQAWHDLIAGTLVVRVPRHMPL